MPVKDEKPKYINRDPDGMWGNPHTKEHLDTGGKIFAVLLALLFIYGVAKTLGLL